MVVGRWIRRWSGLLLGASVLLLAPPVLADLTELFETVAIRDVLIASPATLDRPAVDPLDGITPAGRSVDAGFFTGLVSSENVLAKFTNDSLTQVRNLPLSSSVSAFTFSFDPATNVFRNDEVGLGPILGDRAQTIGRGKFNIGASYQTVKFKTFEGKKLSDQRFSTNIREGRVFTVSGLGAGGAFTGNTALFTLVLDERGGTVPTGTNVPIDFPPALVRNSLGVPQPPGTGCSVRDLALAMDPTFTTCFFEVPGISPGFLESPLVPGGFIDANAQAISPAGTAFLNIAPPAISLDMDLNVDAVNIAMTGGLTDSVDVGFILPVLSIDVESTVRVTTFDNGCADPLDDACNLAFAQGLLDTGNALVNNTRTTIFEEAERATGIGDLAVRGKWQFLASKWVDSALRGTMFFPTGRKGDFLGTGEWAGEITLIASKTYFNRVAAHINTGVYVSGDRYAHQFRYRVGIDALLHPRINIGFDVIGSHDINPDQVGDDIVSIGPGIKWNPWGRLVITGAAILKLNDEGLRADVIPSFNIEYTLD